jgi:hypothetical protein
MDFLKKGIAVPTLCAAAVAATSLLFYAVLAQIVSTELLAEYVAVISLAAMIQITFVPQAWIFVFGAKEHQDRRDRLSTAAVFEWGGSICGLAVAVPIAIWSNYGAAALWAYIALSMAGSTAALGFLRGEGRWGLYAVNVTLPSMLRLAIASVALGTNAELASSLSHVVLVYVLIPECTRYVLMNLLLLQREWRPITMMKLHSSFGQIFRNWIYDIGSGTTEVADKYILSLIVSPTLLVVYFFVRKISVAVTMILEPFYAYRYQSLLHRPISKHGNRNVSGPLVSGYAIALGVSSFSLLAVLLLNSRSLYHVKFIPDVLVSYISLFAACLFIDGFIAANRWGRYLSIMSGNATRLLVVRLFSFAFFIGTVIALVPRSESKALIIGFVCYALIELLYVSKLAVTIDLSAI